MCWFSGDTLEGVYGRPVGLYQWCQQGPGGGVLHHRHSAERAVMHSLTHMKYNTHLITHTQQAVTHTITHKHTHTHILQHTCIHSHANMYTHTHTRTRTHTRCDVLKHSVCTFTPTYLIMPCGSSGHPLIDSHHSSPICRHILQNQTSSGGSVSLPGFSRILWIGFETGSKPA